MNKTHNKLGIGPYIFSIFSFIPLIGIIFGISSIIWGLCSQKSGSKILALIGLLGILSTFLFYGYLAKYTLNAVKNLPITEKTQRLTQENLDALIAHIELYKIQNNTYPANLDELKEFIPASQSNITIDFSDMTFPPTAEKPRTINAIYYEQTGDTYYLLSTGEDDIPFTNDDILPKTLPNAKIGLKTKNTAKPN